MTSVVATPAARDDAGRTVGVRIRRAAESTFALVALLVSVGGAVAVLGAPSWQRSVGPAATPVFVSAQLGALAALLLCGTWAWFARPRSHLALISFAAAATWMAPYLLASLSVAREARSVGLLLAPIFAAVMVHLPVRALRADARGSVVRWAIAGLYVITLGAAVGRAVTYDPFFVLDCLPLCTRGDNVLLWTVDVELGSRLLGYAAIAASIAGVMLATWGTGRLVRDHRQRSTSAVALAAIGLGLSLAWTSIRQAGHPVMPGHFHALGAEDLLLAAVVAATGLAVTWAMAADTRRAQGLRSLIAAAETGAGTRMSELLASSLGDPTVRVIYPGPGGSSWIDETGEPAVRAQPGSSRSSTTIERSGSVVAVVEHEAGLDPGLLETEVGAAARLAVDNARLDATIRSQLRELRASRARIVAAGDAIRGRLERDLHDGAQQRLLAVSFELRLAQTAAQRHGLQLDGLDAAVGQVDRALSELRDLAHGIYPAVLQEAGLEAAIRSLAEESSVPLVIETMTEKACSPASDAAAYFAVAEAVRRATSSGATLIRVDVTAAPNGMRVDVTADGMGSERGWTRAADRVAAADGSLTYRSDSDGGNHLAVVLPCA